MKTQTTKKPFAFIIMMMFALTDANAQSTIHQKDLTIEKAIQPSVVIQIPKVDMKEAKALQKNYSLQRNDFNEHENKDESEFKIEENYLLSANADTQEISSSQEKTNPACPNPPVVGENFEGNALPFHHSSSYGKYSYAFIAPESGIAISNGGKIVSISNGFIYYFNQGNSVPVFKDSLQNFCLGYFDPRVLYDPKKDRFIVSGVFYNNSNLYNPTTHIIGFVTAFSKSNDPMDGWNFYFFPHSAFNQNGYNYDYPQLSISDNEVFITEKVLDQNGHLTNSKIIQEDKSAGYAGGASISSQFYTVGLSGFTTGSVVPVSGGSTTYGPGMYFLMSELSGNKYYVFEITNTIASGHAVLKTYGPVHSNISYYYSVNTAYQPGRIPLDSRSNEVQNAFYENRLIQFCQNSETNGKAAVYVGRISGIPGNLSCTAQTINDPELYLQYPAIAYAGNSSTDNSAIIGLEHSGLQRYPGLSAVFIDKDFKISPLVTVKEGNDTLNATWGDYSGICRRYNVPGEFWMEGQYGDLIFPKVNWVAELHSPAACHEQSIVSTKPQAEKLNTSLMVFPNPFSNSTSISFALRLSQKVSVMIYDVDGRLVKTLANAQFEAGTHEIIWSTGNEKGQEVSGGIYFLKMEAQNYSETKKLSVIK